VLEQRTTQYSQARAEAGTEQRTVLDTLVGRKGLEGHLQAFLLTCRVDNFSKYTIRDYEHKIGQFVRFAASIGIHEVEQVTVDHVRLFLLKQKETCNAVTIYNHYRNLKRFFNWLVEEGRIRGTPMATMKPPRMPTTLTKPLSPEDLRRLVYLCDSSTFLGLRNKAIIFTFIDTAVRLDEMAKIQIDDIDFKRGIIKVMGKGAKERVVPIQQRSQKAILRYLLMRNDTYRCLWVSEERQPLTKWGVQLMIRTLGKRAGIKNVRCSPHTFRHTAATLMLENGAGEFEVQAILGHSTLAMTRRYVASLNSEKAAEAHKRFSPVEHLKL